MNNTAFKQQGQSMTEYLVVLILVGMLLGISFSTHQPSVIEYFLTSVKTGFEKFGGFLTLP